MKSRMLNEAGVEVRRGVTPLSISDQVYAKANRIARLARFAKGGAWNRDQRLVRFNLLLLENSKNYAVLLVMGQRMRRA